MESQQLFVNESMEASRVMLESGASNPITVRLMSGNKTIAYTSSHLGDENDIQNFLELLCYFTISYKEIDGACISAIAAIDERKKDIPEAKKAVIGAYRNRAGKNLAYLQEFNIVANEIFFGEVRAVKGPHNFCQFLDAAFAKSRG
jgi:hypothetical protein